MSRYAEKRARDLDAAILACENFTYQPEEATGVSTCGICNHGIYQGDRQVRMEIEFPTGGTALRTHPSCFNLLSVVADVEE